MTTAATGSPTSDATEGVVDAEHPWPGLASYLELQQHYFFGRNAEIDTLCRRVARKSLTILFGQSGLGKTSLLHAGLFPALRRDGMLPVSIRLDYAESQRALDAQVRSALAEALAAIGGTLPGDANAPVTLWELFHDPERAPRDASGAPIIVVLVLDQFEEMFTHGYASDARRARANAFVSGLAAIVERWVPSAVESRLARDPALAERLEYERDDVRVLISLREDYLPHLEELRAALPSIGGGGMRLTRMTAAQGLDAVIRPASLRPGQPLVTTDVAQQIMAFVSRTRRGGEAQLLASGEVEPALLSLFCRELNKRRLAMGLPTITAELLVGSSEDIIADFYVRAFRDLAPAVRTFVEDELVTDSGVRENMALERAERRLARDGVPPGALDVLVGQRLLHIEERLGTRRVELTHDVLLPVIERSRLERRQREQVEEAERRAADAKRELAARSRKTRGLWAAVGVLSALLVWAVIEQRRASDEEAKTRAESMETSQFIRGVAYLLQEAADSGLTSRSAEWYFLKRGAPYLDSLQKIDSRAIPMTATRGVFTLLTANWNLGYAKVDTAAADSLRQAARDSAVAAVAAGDDLVVRRPGPDSRHEAYDLIWSAAEAQQRVGDAADSDAAVRTLKHAEEILREAEARSDRTEPRASAILARLNDVVGRWSLARTQYAAADSAFARAEDAQRRWAGRRDQADSQVSLTLSVARLSIERGHAHALLGDSAAYDRPYLDTRDTVRAALRRFPPPVRDSALLANSGHTRADSEAVSLSLIYDGLGNHKAAGGDSAGALDVYDHELSIDSLLATRYHDRQSMANLAYTANERGSLRLARRDYAGGAADYGVVVDMRRGIVTSSDHSSADSTELARALGNVAWGLLLSNRAADALAAAEQALRMDKRLVFIWTNYADALLLTNHYDEAMRVYRAHWRDALNNRTTLGQSILGIRNDPANPGDLHDLAAAGITDPALQRAARQLRAEFPGT
jgi:tetratricopeptide (TPR) repeat protein